ncbi:MAG: DUF4019 domain-containing protein [Deltaproteobacteria bacterium]|nr:DUF4019 domain-containing protein [Deltaproteobacteria bacterium]
MAWKVAAGLGTAVVLSVCVAMATESDKLRVALSSAENWICLVEEGKYSDSWDQAACYFKGAVKQEKWQKTLQATRKPLGTVISRKLKSKSYHTSLPGAPDGDYVVIRFETSFEDKKFAVETVTPKPR